MKLFTSTLARVALCASMLFGATAANAGIPVIDVAALVQAVQEVMQSIEQITNQIRQIEQLQSQYQAITGARNLGDVMNNPALQNYIPANATQLLGNVQSSGYSGLTDSARTLRDAQMTYNCLNLSGSAQTQCQSGLAMPYQQKALMQDAMDAARGRIGQIQSLMQQINATPDAKAVAEIQARLDAENAMLQHQQTQINLARGMADADARIAESRAKEGQLQQASRTGRLEDFLPR
ncbi:MAG: P-type DNA transfer protein VirB5 [Pseudomonadota bacterium]|nr:P-type DNA transfer protein VirB5 [Pseudomonadota bacterium]